MRTMSVLTLLAVSGSILAQDYSFPAQTTDQPRYLGGLQISRSRDGTTVVSVGGALFSRKVTVVAPTSEGAVVTRFTLPSQFHSPTTPPFDLLNPLGNRVVATIRVEAPDDVGVVYVEGAKIPSRGFVRVLESPPLPTDRTTSLHLRFAYLSGDHVLIEDRTVAVRGGTATTLAFDGRGVVAVPISVKD